MFPGKKDNYGSFTKTIFEWLATSKYFGIYRLAAIRGKSYWKIYNIIRYIFLLSNIFRTLIFCLNKFDIIYIQYIWKHAFFTSLFCNRLKTAHKKMVINFHGEDLFNFNKLSKSEKKQFKKLCCYADLVIIPSMYFKNILLQLDITNPKKLFISASGGVNSINFFKSSVNTNSMQVIYCSRIDKNKGWDDFLDAAEQLLSKNPKYNFILLGYGKEVPQLKAKLNTILHRSKIKFIENPMHNDIANIYRYSDLFVFPTKLNESLGLVALEAMSCSLPVIGANIGALNEYIFNDNNGYLYTSGNIKELVRNIEKYFSLPIDEKMRMRSQARIVSEKYKDSNVKKEFLEKLSSL